MRWRGFWFRVCVLVRNRAKIRRRGIAVWARFWVESVKNSDVESDGGALNFSFSVRGRVPAKCCLRSVARVRAVFWFWCAPSPPLHLVVVAVHGRGALATDEEDHQNHETDNDQQRSCRWSERWKPSDSIKKAGKRTDPDNNPDPPSQTGIN